MTDRIFKWTERGINLLYLGAWLFVLIAILTD